MSRHICQVPECKESVNNQIAPLICFNHWRIMPDRHKAAILGNGNTAKEYKRAVAEGIRAVTIIEDSQPGKYPYYKDK